MKIKRLLRLLALVLFIAIASIIPFPMSFHKRDRLPKHLIERIDKTKQDDTEEDIFQVQ